MSISRPPSFSGRVAFDWGYPYRFASLKQNDKDRFLFVWGKGRGEGGGVFLYLTHYPGCEPESCVLRLHPPGMGVVWRVPESWLGSLGL